ncbi:MAG: nucleotidyltransferase domain-containing protein [Solobacterium sp.]|nr:nucleotidyltransferase domain-containing protein [Solobacterium sp.]
MMDKEEIIKEIEKHKAIKIIFMADCGSKAWGYESETSDEDVRFIYVRELKDYLRIDETNDFIEYKDEHYDITGFDISKALKLIYKSNYTINEWLNSPLIYHSEECMEKVQNLAYDCFCPTPIIKHCIDDAQKNFKKVLRSDNVLVKHYLQVLRSLSIGLYADGFGAFPYEDKTRYVLDREIYALYLKLIDIKKSDRNARIKSIEYLNEYIMYELDHLSSIKPETKINDINKINQTFYEIVKQYEDNNI